MEEKIIEAKFNKNTLGWTLLTIGIALFVLAIILGINEYNTRLYYESNYSFGIYKGTTYITASEYHGSFFAYMLAEIVSFICFEGFDYWSAPILCLGIIVILLSLFFFLQMSRGKLIITNTRVTGKTSFGKTVDLPLNQISAVAVGACQRITVATSSGRVNFWFIKNREEIHTTLTDIIGKVQIDSVTQQTNTAPTSSSADELKKYKDLLDNGIITQEEFEAKKKQLLGL